MIGNKKDMIKKKKLTLSTQGVDYIFEIDIAHVF